jgi:hypothetical protein
MRPEEAEELRELQDPDSWDWEAGELHPPVPDPKTVVAVEFTSEEFNRLGMASHQAGVRVTKFVHDLVIAHLAARSRQR